MDEKDLSPEQSLELIQSMIGRARKRYTDNSFFFLLWGWITLVASLTHFYLGVYTSYEHPYIGWSLSFVGGIVSAIYGSRMSKRSKVTNYTDKLYGWLWTSLGIAMFVIIFNGELVKWVVVPFIMLLAGVGTLMSGVMMNFKPLQLGSGAFWILALVAFRQTEPNQMLLMAVAVGLGYLLPGYIMKYNARRNGI